MDYLLEQMLKRFGLFFYNNASGGEKKNQENMLSIE